MVLREDCIGRDARFLGPDCRGCTLLSRMLRVTVTAALGRDGVRVDRREIFTHEKFSSPYSITRPAVWRGGASAMQKSRRRTSNTQH